MNLFDIIARGVRLSGGTEADRIAEKTRQRWADKLMAHETRAWMNIDEADREALSNLAVLLTLSGAAHIYDGNSIDSPTVRIIRGAISAAEQCGKAGSVITVEHAQAFSAACAHARTALNKASAKAINHSASYLAEVTGSAA